MKIYQIHEYGGEWEDSYDYIVASYLSEEKAMEGHIRLEKEEAILSKCKSCPIYYCHDNCDNNCEECYEKRAERAREYCDRYEPYDRNKHDDEYEYDSEKCVNYYYGDISFYKVEEVEVIE